MAFIFYPQTSEARAEPPILLLDFTGYQGNFNGRIVDVPAYDIDGNENQFSGVEMMHIHEIHERVKEDFSPFHIEVNYDPWLDAKTSDLDVRVVIGGTRDDSDIRSYGEADFDRNLGIVPITLPCAGANLPDYCDPVLKELPSSLAMLCDSSSPPAKGCPILKLEAWDIAHGASHEAGHIIVGWNPLPRWLAHYLEQPWNTDPLNEWDRAALMGTHVKLRDTWWHHDDFPRGIIPGTSEVVEGPQDDIGELMAVLQLATDSGGNLPASAPVLPLGPTYRTMWVNGVISMNAESWPTDKGPFGCNVWQLGVGFIPCFLIYLTGHDTDFWRFYVRNDETIEVEVTTVNSLSERTRANLVPGIELWRKMGSTWSLVPGAFNYANTDTWKLRIQKYLAAGEYAVGVKSTGGYGDLGQYTLRVLGDHIGPSP